VQGVQEEHNTGTEWLLMGLSLGAAGLGWGMAWRSYRHADKGYKEPIAAISPPAYNILLKQERLTRDERMKMNAHPVLGAEIIAPVTKLAPELPIIRHHHEWYNGSGYPDRLAGDQIPLSARLVRSAKRLADGLKAQWTAAYVEGPVAARLSQADRDRVSQTLRLAAQLGAATVTLTGPNVAEEILSYAHDHGVTKVVIGKPERPRSLAAAREDLPRRGLERLAGLAEGVAQHFEHSRTAFLGHFNAAILEMDDVHLQRFDLEIPVVAAIRTGQRHLSLPRPVRGRKRP